MSESRKSQDPLSPEERSDLMSRVSSEETEPEKLTRSLLHRAGYQFRKNVSELAGTPDVVLPKYDTVIFVHGCFWHRHDCTKGNNVPTNNQEFWLTKFEQNVERDSRNEAVLQDQGWQVLTVWECELNDDPAETIDRITERLDSQLE